MISGISQNDPTANSSGTNSATSGKTASTGTTQVTKNMFLQLLVAQIKNQDPTQPMDSTAFLSQLAQFSQLEQLVGIRQDMEKPSTSATTPPAGN